MLLTLAQWLQTLSPEFGFFRVFQYITFRAVMAAMTALLIGLVAGPAVIRRLTSLKIGQPIRGYGMQTHLAKSGTPTMGGVLILIGIAVATLLWADLSNRFVWIVLLVTLGFGAIGLYDDYLKVTKATTKGFSGKVRLLAEFVIAGIAVGIFMWIGGKPLSTSLAVPFFKDLLIPFGMFFIFVGMFVVVGAGNAVNLTDGLDGLAIVPVMIAAASLGLIVYLVGNYNFSNYLELHFVKGAGELAIICGAIVGAGLGFLWFNAPPAMIFMGDTGSLSLGGALGAIAVAAKHEIVLGIIGGLFVLETMSVIIQVASFKMTGKRVFAMAPLHHHFEQKGWKEPQIVIRFWIIAFVLALTGLATLKLR